MSKDEYKTSKKPDSGVDRKAIFDDEKVFSHESYGMVQFSRITGRSGRLFGSSLPDQGSFIRLRVVRADRRHHLGRDWYHGESKVLFEADLSNVQFAELITTMNHGQGAPCTLRFCDGKPMEKPPEEKLEDFFDWCGDEETDEETFRSSDVSQDDDTIVVDFSEWPKDPQRIVTVLAQQLGVEIAPFSEWEMSVDPL